MAKLSQYVAKRLLKNLTHTKKSSSNKFIDSYTKWNRKYFKIINSAQYNIYCTGEILHVIQMKHLYPDSKRFVDKKLRLPPEEVLENFSILKRVKPSLPSYALSKFLKINFEDEHSLRQYTPPDWHPTPKSLEVIKDRRLLKFSYELHEIWKRLSRRIYDDCLTNSHLYSLLYVPKPFVIPGGRFREYYYWDSYWIIRGLVLCEMYESAKAMIENYLYLIDKYGIIPNGGRIYYVDRSQPPLLAKMLETYIDFTDDTEFLQVALPFVEEEFLFWENTRSVDVIKGYKSFQMFHYDSFQFTPRPESYREDYRWALAVPLEKRPAFYNQVRAAAESGVDFSSRWWLPDWDTRPDFINIHASHIIPVDLNSILENNARILAKFFKKVGNERKYTEYLAKSDHIMDGIDQVLWNKEIGTWFDYDYVNDIPRQRFYPSNLTPLWTKSYPVENKVYLEKILKYLKTIEIFQIYVGGIPSSLKQTGEQWDLPNAWAPHQDMVISGLADSNNDEARELGRVLGKRWIRHNYIMYKERRAMFEKYSSIMTGIGEGGEYKIQKGFGWTNGVIIDFLIKFSDIHLDVQEYL